LQVVHIVRQFSPSIGGLEASVLNLATAQRKRFDIDARVVSLNRLFGRNDILPASEIISGIPVSRIPWRGSPRYPLAPTVLNHLHGADMVHVHAIEFFFDYLALTAPLHRKHLVASTHGGFFHTKQQSALKKLWFKTITKASILTYDRIIACSHSDADLFETVAGGRLALIENGIDQSRFMGAASAVQTRNIICFGRLSEHKRIAELFPMMRELRSKNPDWRLIVAGRESGQTVEQLCALAAEQQVGELVRFNVNPSDAELRKEIGGASYFACLSSYEGFGLAAVEAMSAGLFPILSSIAPFRRLHEETNLGLIAEPAALAAVSTEIEASVLGSADSYTKRQARLVDSVQRYDWENAAAKYVRIYEDILSARSKQPRLVFRQ
jgi:alpha-1,3-mannosyltransferase